VARRVDLHELTVFPNGKDDDHADSTAQQALRCAAGGDT
jgi:phage terminase large subunit-like protein